MRTTPTMNFYGIFPLKIILYSRCPKGSESTAHHGTGGRSLLSKGLRTRHNCLRGFLNMFIDGHVEWREHPTGTLETVFFCLKSSFMHSLGRTQLPHPNKTLAISLNWRGILEVCNLTTVTIGLALGTGGFGIMKDGQINQYSRETDKTENCLKNTELCGCLNYNPVVLWHTVLCA